jgi:hypothetical protein
MADEPWDVDAQFRQIQADLHEELVTAADAQVRRIRRGVVASLANAHEKLMERPACERDVLDDQLRYELRTFVPDRAAYASDHYRRAAASAEVESVQQEMNARAAHVRAFSESIVNAAEDRRPWLAAMSVTTAEVVSPEKLPELRETQEWGLMQQASIEATVSCMPPSPKGWTAADGAGIKRLEEQHADVAAWLAVDRLSASERSSDEPTGHQLREAVGQRLKVSCQRTDTSQSTMDRAFSKAYEFDTRNVAMESFGVTEGGDLEEEAFVPVPDQDGLSPTSDWWALRNGVPVEIDSFPAPNESVQQHADVRFKLPRQVWEASRDYMGPAFDHVVIEGENDVDVTVSATQRVELRERAEDVQFTSVYNAQERIELIQNDDDYGLDGGEAVQQVGEAAQRCRTGGVPLQCRCGCTQLSQTGDHA